MNSYEAKLERRRERLEARAGRLRREGQARAKRGWEQLELIPFGQPILVGHHSEKRDRNYRTRACNAIDKGMALQKEAGELEARAASVGTGGISSDDPEAVRKLKEQLELAEGLQVRMVAANKLVRKFKSATPEAIAAFAELGISQAHAVALFEPDYAGRTGFAGYELTNNGANIRRIKARIAELGRKPTETKETEAPGGIRMVENAEENRVQLFFPGKPADAVRTLLKSRGFKWSPYNGAWQRHLNNSGIWNAKCIIEELTKEG